MQFRWSPQQGLFKALRIDKSRVFIVTLVSLTGLTGDRPAASDCIAAGLGSARPFKPRCVCVLPVQVVTCSVFLSGQRLLVLEPSLLSELWLDPAWRSGASVSLFLFILKFLTKKRAQWAGRRGSTRVTSCDTVTWVRSGLRSCVCVILLCHFQHLYRPVGEHLRCSQVSRFVFSVRVGSFKRLGGFKLTLFVHLSDWHSLNLSFIDSLNSDVSFNSALHSCDSVDERLIMWLFLPRVFQRTSRRSRQTRPGGRAVAAVAVCKL